MLEAGPTVENGNGASTPQILRGRWRSLEFHQGRVASDTLCSGVRDGSLELAGMVPPSEEAAAGLEFEEIRCYPFYVAINTRHALAGMKTIPVERSATLTASPAALFEQVNDHHKSSVWNPFLKLDPNVKNSYSGPDSGVGAVCSWEGNSDIGAGSATIIESKPGELVRERMDWKRPMEGVATADFTFKPEDDKTVVTWAMYGKNNFMGKVVGLFVDCDKMVGTEFEKGLASLGEVAAAAPAK